MKTALFYLILLFSQTLISAQTSIKFNETFALYVKDHGYIKYESRDYGINLVWSNVPVYEWKFMNGSSTSVLPANTPIALYNLTANDYVVYAERDYGINLKWQRDTKVTNANDWQVEGMLLGMQPCIFLRNVTQLRKNTKSYITYGERDKGINLVWNNKPSSCNIQLFRSPVYIHNDVRTSLPRATPEDNIRYQQAVKQMDVIGTNFYGEKFIGMARAERSDIISVHSDNWFPIDGYKRTVCGNMIKYFAYDGSVFSDNDDDLNLNIVPTPDFSPLLDQGIAVARQRTNKNDLTFPHIQAEIDVLDAPYKDFFYPNKLSAPKLNNQVCAFGPFVSDKGHDHKPEIHTAEQIWWREGTNAYFLSYMCDVSGRFDGLLDSNDPRFPNLNDTGDDYDTDNGKHSFGGPWSPRPIEGSYAIAFKVPLGKQRMFFDIRKVAGKNYEPVASQPANAHYLIYQQDTLALVTESDDLDMNVSFELVTVVPGLTKLNPSYVQGFVVLKIKTGKAYTGFQNGKRTDEGGQLLIKVNKWLFRGIDFTKLENVLTKKE